MSSAMAFATRASLSDNAKAVSYCCCSSSWRESSKLLPSHSTHSPASVFISSVYRYWRFVHNAIVGDALLVHVYTRLFVPASAGTGEPGLLRKTPSRVDARWHRPPLGPAGYAVPYPPDRPRHTGLQHIISSPRSAHPDDGEVCQGTDSQEFGEGQRLEPVSYTHLTLPTIYSV